MKTAMKRVFGLVLCFVLIFSLFPATQAYADLGSGSCGPNANWTLSNDGTLTISGSGAMNNYGNDRPWSAYNYSIKTLVVKSGITYIGDYAFANCANLTSASIASSVTGIGKGAFTSTGLTSITIPSNVTSIGVSAFEYCTSLSSVTLPAKLTAIANRCFFWCTSLKSVSIPVGVTSIGESAFEECKAMTSVTIPNGMTSIGAKAFLNCENLGSVTLPAGVASVGASAFEGCRKLTSASLPNGLTSIGEAAFKDCSALGSIKLPVGLTSVSNDAFNGCASATSLTIPSGVTSIGARAFKSCSSLGSISVPSGVTSIGDYAFMYCSSASSVSLPSGLASIGEYGFAYTTALTSVTIPSTVTSIGNYAFYASGLTSVTIPASVKTLGANPFSHCLSLSEIKVSSDNSNYSAAGGVLFNKNKTTLLAYPAGKSGSSYTVPGTVKNIGDHSFEYNPTLQSVSLPNGVSYIGASAFNNCSALESVSMPGSVTTLGACAFSECTALKSISIPTGVTQIPDYCFYHCNSLSSVSLPKTVTSIGDHAFRLCSSLSAITLPSALERIGVTAFAYSGLESIIIPTSVKNIAMYAFSGCNKLTKIAFQGSAPSIGDMAFNAVTATVNYPDDGSWTSENRLNYGGHLTWSGFTQVTILEQPEDVTAVAGKTANFTITATGANLKYQWQVRTSSTDVWDNVNPSIYSGGTTATLSVPATNARNGYQYRCVVSNSSGSVASNMAKLKVVQVDKPVITTQPVNTSATPGTKAYFNIMATGKNLDYQWQVRTKSTEAWDNVNPNIYSGCNSTTLTVPATLARNGYQFRCVVSNAGGTATSNTVTLTVADFVKPVIKKQPTDVTAANGTDATFSVTAEGQNLSYQWQVKTKSDGNWADVDSSFSGAKSATLTIPATTARNGYQYRCIVSNEAGSVISSAAKLTVSEIAKPVITKQPTNVSAAHGTTAKFSLTATGEGLSYQWQVRTNSADLWDAVNPSIYSGGKTATLSVPATLARNGYQYRCMVTNAGGTVYSSVVTLTVGSANAPKITKQPADVSAASSTTATVSLTATGDSLVYQWQVRTSSTDLWDAVNPSIYSGCTIATLTIPVTTARNGYQFRCRVSNSEGEIYSNVVTLTVTSASTPKITTQPTNVTATAGSTAKFTVAASGEGLSYQWQVRTKSSEPWDAVNPSIYSGGTTATLSVPATLARNGYEYRCVVSNSAGNVASSSAKLTVGAMPTIKTQPVNVMAGAGTTAKFTVVASGEGLSYQWQVRTKSTEPWDAVNPSIYTGGKTATLSVPVTMARNGYEYRCVVTNVFGSVNSNTVTLTVTA